MWALSSPTRDPTFLLAWFSWDILFPCLGLGLTLLEGRFFTTGPPGKTHLKLTLARLKYSLDQLFLYKHCLTRNNYCGYFHLVSEYCQPQDPEYTGEQIERFREDWGQSWSLGAISDGQVSDLEAGAHSLEDVGVEGLCGFPKFQGRRSVQLTLGLELVLCWKALKDKKGRHGGEDSDGEGRMLCASAHSSPLRLVEDSDVGYSVTQGREICIPGAQRTRGKTTHCLPPSS